VSRRALLAGVGAAAIAQPLAERTLAQAEFGFTLSTFVEGFDRPLFMADANDGSGRFFVVEQGGLIRIVVGGQILDEPWLDLSDQVTSGGEQGLLGLALHPEFAENGIAFVDYTDLDGNTQVVRYAQSADDPNRLDPASAMTILTVEQPARNHNGGMLEFGPDGMLYVSLGDGGNQGDPDGHGQDIGTLLGSILRIDVDPVAEGYEVPEGNPFDAVDGAQGEIWVYGLRNPWRFSFDRETGDLWIGDVGQNAAEEIDVVPAGTSGQNFGWNLAEGFECYADPDCQSADIVWPVFTYGRDVGLSVVGGYVYRGSTIDGLTGRYLLGDYGTGYLWVLSPEDDETWSASEPIPTDLTISSFAEDASGELYVIDLNGSIRRIVPG
jgi:glucose/arabinose dehydrogenase